jgi:DNA-binding CsgD family transcriptional regulator
VVSGVTALGRGDELARVDAVLETVREHAASVVVEGDPGIGKSVIWREGVERARARGFRVLLAQPSEFEATLGFAGLGDLLGEAVDRIGALPDPQRRALRVALLHEDASGRPPDARLLGAALLGLLRILADDGPVVVAIDDLHWLDAPTAGALAFALRRVGAEPVGLLGAARTGTVWLPGVDAERLPVGPLDLSTLDKVIRAAVGTALPLPLLRRVEATAGGNPFYALELARALERRAGGSAARDLPLPSTLADVVAERLDALDAGAREAVLATAALSAPTVELVDAVTGSGDAVTRAEQAGVIGIEDDGSRVRLGHPLFGSVAYATAPSAHRRALHARFAELVSAPEDRARHLALAASGPDEVVAAAVEDAARHARGRGAAETAAELGELSVELTPELERSRALARRALAGDCYLGAGDALRAEALLESVVTEMEPGADRARLLWRLGSVKANVGGVAAAYTVYEQALAEADDDHRLAAQIHDRLATWRWIGEGAFAARRHARALVELAEKVREQGLLARAIGAELALEVASGDPFDRARYDRMLALEQQAPDHGVELPGSTLHHQLLTWAGEYDESRVRIGEFLTRARERGETAQILPLWTLGFLDILTADWHAAVALIDRALELVEQGGRAALVPGHLSLRAIAYAHLGDADRAERDAERAIAGATRMGQEIHVLGASTALALLDLSSGQLASAQARYAQIAAAIERRGDRGVGEWWLPDEIEARVGAGDVDEAARRTRHFSEDSERAGLPRFLSLAARCRGLVAAARGELEVAAREYELALEHQAEFSDEYQRARTLFALGSLLRRRQRRSDAHETLAAAVAGFEAVDAARWVARTRAELARIGGRPSSPSGLTATERQIAALVGAGRSNAQVAATLSISPRTVEWNLSKIYRKLHIRSRAELAAHLAGTSGAGH